MPMNTDWLSWQQQQGGGPNPLAPLAQQFPDYAAWTPGGSLAAPGGYTAGTGTAATGYTAPTMYAQQAAPAPAPTPTLTGGPPPVGPGGMAAPYSNPNANSVAAPAPPAGGTFDPGWNSNMLGQKAGMTWDGKQWVGPGQFRAAGSQLGAGGVTMTAAYDPNRDTLGQDMSTHAGGDTNWMKVNRWMADGVREHGLTPQAAYDAALSRLKRDYELNGQDWGRSGFDLSHIQSAAVGQDFGAGGTTAGKAVGAVPPTAGTTPPTTGTAPPATTPQAGAGGQPFADEAAVDMVRANADQALAAIRGGRGGRDMSGPVGKYRESLMARTLQAYLSMFGVGGDTGGSPVANANQGLAELVKRQQGGQGIGDLIRQSAAKMMHGIDFSNMDNSQILDILNLAGGAGTLGYSPIAQYQMQNALGDMQDAANIQGQRGTDPTHAVLGTRQGRGQFDDILQRFLAAQGR